LNQQAPDTTSADWGSQVQPLDVSTLAEVLNVTIGAPLPAIPGEGCAEGLLIPVPGGFVARVAPSSTHRWRLTLCHELAHTYFYDHRHAVPLRPRAMRPSPLEEQLCFDAARHMLAPLPEVHEYTAATTPIDQLSFVVERFAVSPSIAADQDRRVRSDSVMISIWRQHQDGSVAKRGYPTKPFSRVFPDRRRIHQRIEPFVRRTLAEGRRIFSSITITFKHKTSGQYINRKLDLQTLPWSAEYRVVLVSVSLSEDQALPL